MKKCLLVIDYQYDFVSENGALSLGEEALKIEDNIMSKIETYTEAHTYFTFDLHTKKDWDKGVHPETRIFEAHCIENTKGYSLYGKLKHVKVPASHYINKNAYCPDNEHIKSLVSNYDFIEICGVATDICVFQTVIGLYTFAINNKKNLGLKISSNCCASSNSERGYFALKYMKEILGVDIDL